MQLERDLPDFVEKERSTVRGFESPDTIPRGSGERALRVAEELALIKIPWYRGAIHANERRRSAPAPPMNGLGDELLACPRLSGDEHARIGRCDEIDLAREEEHRGTRADDGRVVVRGHDLTQVLVLPLQSFLQSRYLLEGPSARDGRGRVIGEELEDVDRRLFEVDPNEHAEDAERLLSVNERLSTEAPNALLAHPVRSRDVRVCAGVGHDERLASGEHLSHFECADRNPSKRALESSVDHDLVAVVAQGAGGEMQTGLLGGTVRCISTSDASIAGAEQPDAGQRHIFRALRQPTHDERQQRFELALLRDLEQQILKRSERARSRLREEHAGTLARLFVVR